MEEYSDVKEAAWADSQKKSINCSVKFIWMDDYVPFTASLSDSQQYGMEIFNECTSGQWGDIAEYIAPAIDYGAMAESQRQSLLTAAYDKIADWKIELQLETISDDGKDSLIKWMAYIKALKALNLSDVKDEEEYKKIEWPTVPE